MGAVELFTMAVKLVMDKSEYDEELGGLAGGLDKAFGTAAKVGAAAIDAVTSGVAAFTKSSVDAGMAFDKAMAQVAATSGKSVGEIGELREFAQQMGATTAFSATQAAEALNYMALAGYGSETSMKMLPSVLNLAAAGDMDLARASDMVTDAQTALGLSLDETSIMVDQMAKASSTTNTSVEQLGDAFLTIGGNAKSVKGGTAELSSVLGALADNGIKGSEAGTHLRNILLAMNPTTDAAAQAWEDLGVQAYDAEGNLRPLDQIFGELNEAMEDMTDQERTDLISKMFNKTDLASVNALLGTTKKRWTEIKTAVDSGLALGSVITDEGITEMRTKFQELYDKVGGDTEAFSKEAKKYIESTFDIGTENGEAAIEAFTEAMKKGVTSTEELEDALKKSNSAAQEMANTQLDNLDGDITLMKSALEGVQIAVSDGVTPVLRKLVQGASEGLSKITTKLREYLAREETQQKLEKIAEAVGKVIQLVIDNLDKIFNVAITVINGILSVVGFLVEHIDLVAGALGAVGAAIGVIKAINVVKSIIGVISAIKTVIGIIGGVGTLIGALANPITLIVAAVAAAAAAIILNWDKIKEAWGKAVEFFGQVWEGIKGVFATVGSWISDIFSTAWSGVKQAWSGTTQFFGNVWNGIKGAFKNVGSWFGEKFSSAKKAVTNAWSNIGTTFSNYKNKIQNAFQNIGDWFGTKFSSAKTSVINAWSNIGERFSHVREVIFSVFKNAPDRFLSIGRNLMIGLYNGIVEKAQAVIDKIKGVASEMIGWAKNILGIKSPSKVFKQIGQFVDLGMAGGIEGNLGKVQKAMNEMSNVVMDGVPEPELDLAIQNQRNRISNGFGMGGQMFSVPRQETPRNLTVILELDRMQLARAVYQLNNQETQRVGMRLAGGYA